MSEPLCRSRYIFEGRLWRCRIPVFEAGETCTVGSHMCDTPPRTGGRDNTLTWETSEQVPADLVAVIEHAEQAAPAFDWQLLLSHDDAANRRVVEMIGSSREPRAAVDEAAAAAFPEDRLTPSFVDEGYSIVFGEATLPTGEECFVQLTTEIPGHRNRPWDSHNGFDA